MDFLRRIARHAAIIIVLSIGILFPGCADAQLSLDAITRINELLLRSAELANAYGEISDAASGYSNAVNWAADAARGVRPTDPDPQWSKAVASYAAAAATIKSDTFAVTFDEAPFSVSLTELYACHLRDNSLELLRRSSTAFQGALDRGEIAQQDLRGVIKDAAAIQAAATQLQRLLEKRPNLFGADMLWLELQNSVLPSIGELLSVARARAKELGTALPLLRLRKSNLDGNVKSLEGIECNLAGLWKGTIAIEGMPFPMTLELTGAPGNYQFSYGIKGKINSKPCIVALNASERRLVWRPACVGPAKIYKFEVNLTASYTSLSGRETDDTDSATEYPIAMQRQ